jgi:hypothetical protein
MIEEMDIISDYEADMAMLKINEIDQEMNSITLVVKKEIEYIKEWNQSRKSKLERQRKYLMRVLETYMMINNKSKLNLPHGKASYRKQPYKVDILDENLLITQGYFREKQSLDKKSIMDNFKKTGEIPQGCDIIKEEEKLYVKPSEIGGSNGAY